MGTKVKLIAEILIFLIITIPFYVADVYATGFSNVKVYGTNNVENFIKDNDILTIEADVDTGEDTIQASQVRFDGNIYNPTANMGMPFDNCADKHCTLAIATSQYVFQKPTHAIYLFLFDSENVLKGQSSKSVRFDNLAPTASITVSPANIGIGTLTISYNAVDPENSQNKCLGIDKIEISKGSFVEIINGTSCSLTGNIQKDATVFGQGTHKLTIKAIDKLGHFSTAESNTFTIDLSAPLIGTFTLTKDSIEITEINNLTLDNVILTAVITGDDTDISRVYADLSGLTNNNADNNVKGTCSALQNSQTTCTWNFNIRVNTARANTAIIKVYDLSNNINQQTFAPNVNIPITSIPEIYDFDILSKATQRSLFYINGRIDVIVKVWLPKDSTDISADFSSFIAGATLRKPNKIYNVEDKKIAEWYLTLDFTQTTDISFTVKAKDQSGNIITKTFSRTLTLDNQGPVINSITTNSFFDDKYFIGPNTNITVSYSDAAGFAKETIFLDLSSIGLGNKLSANFCSASDCIWSGLNVNSADGTTATISVHPDSADILGNKVSETKSLEITTDKTSPNIIGFDYDSKYPVSGDVIKFILNATDEVSGIAKLEVNASSISNDVFPKQGSCNKQDNVYICQVDVAALKTGFLSGKVFATVFDGAGNTKSIEKEVSVFELDINAIPNFFNVSKIEIIPSKIDRKVSSQIAISLFLHPFLQAKQNANIVSLNVDCSDFIYKSETPYIINEGLDPYIAIKTAPAIAYANDSVKLICELSIKVKQGNKVYNNPEKENITANIELFNVPLGDIGQAAIDKIKGIEDNIEEKDKKIKFWKKWNKNLGTICTVAELIGNIDAAIQAVFTFLAGVGCVLEASGIAERAGKKVHAAGCETGNPFHEKVKKWVWDNDFYGKGVLKNPGYYFKWVCSIYSCRLADASFYANLGLSILSGALKSQKVVEVQLPQDKQDVLKQSGSSLTMFYIPNNQRTDLKYDEFKDIKWYSEATTTVIGSPIQPGTWVWDPYKSIHYAYGFMCIPGIIYNLEKDKQISCIQKKCIEETSKTGIPFYPCDIAAKERYCLYVDSAAYKLHGFIGEFFKNMILGFFKSLFTSFRGVLTAAGFACNAWQGNPMNECAEGQVSVCESIPDRICGAVSAAQAIIQMMDVAKQGFNFGPREAELKGTNYCGD